MSLMGDTSPQYPPGVFKDYVEPVDVNALGKDAQRLVAWTLDNYEKMKRARRKIEYQWYMNMAFFRNKQNVVWTSTSDGNFRLTERKAPYWYSRMVVNKVMPGVLKQLAKLLSQKPNAYVVPASSDDKDLFAAQAGEEVWEATWRRKNVKETLEECLWWTCVTGNGWIKGYWDETVVDCDSQCLGDVCIETETPFHIYVPELRQKKLDYQPYLIHASVRSVDWVMMRYEKTLQGKEFKPNVRKEDDILNNAYRNLIGTESSPIDSTLVLEVWVKPGVVRILPQGGMFTIISDQLVQMTSGWPYSHGEYPYTKIGFIPTESFYNESAVSYLISLQRELNRTHNQIVESKNKMSKPQLMAPEGSVDPAKITSEPGLVIEYKPGYEKPSPLPLQNLPNYVMEEEMSIRERMDDILGTHETPSGVTAATAISYLQEQDDTQLSLAVSSIESGLERLGKHTLYYVTQYYDVPRLIKTTGGSETFGILMLKGSDIMGNTDLKIEAGSGLPTSRAAKQAFIMDLMKLGFIPPQLGLQLMEVGGTQKLYEMYKIDVRQAQRENVKMLSLDEQTIQLHEMQMMQQGEMGEPPQISPIVPVNTWDEHFIHVQEHNKTRKSQHFELASEQVKQQFEMHVQWHIAAMSNAFQGSEEGPIEGEEAEEEPMSDEPGPLPQPEMQGGM